MGPAARGSTGDEETSVVSSPDGTRPSPDAPRKNSTVDRRSGGL